MYVTIDFNFALNYNMFNSSTFKYECITILLQDHHCSLLKHIS